MATRMQQRRGTAAQWTAANPILAAGEIGFETDTSKFKMGNGSSVWSALTYFANAAELAAIVDGAPDLLNTLNELAAAIGDDADFFTNIADNISGSIDQHNGTTDVHGIANTALLATLTNVSTAQTNAESFATTAVTNHSNDTTMVHGIDDTSALAKTADVTTAINNAVSTHSSDTTSIHGIDDTANLATKTYADGVVSTHSDDTTDVHGITNTADLATKTYADTSVSTHSDYTTDVHGITNTADLATKSYADTAVSTHQADTTDVHGIADTSLLATTDYVDTAVGNSVVDQSLLAGVGLDWNTTSEQYDIDSTVATKTYADGAVSSAVTALTKSSVGLANVDNTSDANKPISSSTQTALDLKAPLASPTFTGTVSGVTKTHVGLANVDNTSDANKPISSATQTALDLKETVANVALKAPLASPTFTGTVTIPSGASISGFALLASPALTGVPTAPTATTGTDTTQVATTGFVQQEIAILTTGAPGLLNTLDELAAALGDDANYAATVTAALTAKAPLASPTFTGTVTLPTGTVTSGMILDGTIVDADINASAAIAQSKISGLSTSLGLKANLASPTFTGTVTVAASGVAFTDGTQTKEGVASQTPIVQKTASYTLSALTERDSLIEVSSATGVTITIPTNTAVAYPIGTSIDILQTGAGQVTIAPVDGTVTVNATPGLKLRTTWSSATLFKRAANTWVVFGDLTA